MSVTGTFSSRARAGGASPAFNLYSLRHTHATLLLLQAGVHPKVVSERLGHATVAITLDTYSHVLPNMQHEAAEKLDGLLFRPHTGEERRAVQLDDAGTL